MNLIISIAAITLNCYLIIYASRSNLEFAANKIILYIITTTLIIILNMTSAVTQANIYSIELAYFVFALQKLLVAIIALVFYEFSHLKKLNTYATISVLSFSALGILLTLYNPKILYYYNVVLALSVLYQVIYFLRNKFITWDNKYIIIFICLLISTFLRLLKPSYNGFDYTPIILSVNTTIMFFIFNNYAFNSAYKNISNRIIDEVSNLIIAFNKNGKIVFVNKEFCNVFDLNEIDLIGLNLYDQKKCSEIFKTKLYKAIIENNNGGDSLSKKRLHFIKEKNEDVKIEDEGKEVYKFNNKYYKKTFDKSFKSKELLFTIVNFIDMTKEITQSYELKTIGEKDSLTNLKNRNCFEADLDRSDNASYKNITLINIDADNLKATNDVFGHSAGDLVLVSIANILNEVFSNNSNSNVYRLGGDEFCIIVINEDVAETITKVKEIFSLADKFNDTNKYPLFFSIGVASTIKIKDIEIKKAVDLYKFADITMYKSKSAGKNTYTIFDIDIYQEYIKENKLKDDFVRGMANNEITLFLQPSLNTNSLYIDNAEALVRWNHPTLGILSPFKFLEIATSLKLIAELDMIIFEKTCKTLQSWKKKYDIEYNISINLSIESLLKPTLFYEVSNIIDKYNTNPQCITFEVLEDKMIKDFESVKNVLQKFQNIGIRIAIDDFGSGFSNFDTIAELNADFIKLDKSIMDNVAKSPKHLNNINLICTLLKSYNCLIIAEGIETLDQVEATKELDIDFLQGYYFNKPIPVNKFEELYIKEQVKY